MSRNLIPIYLQTPLKYYLGQRADLETFSRYRTSCSGQQARVEKKMGLRGKKKSSEC